MSFLNKILALLIMIPSAAFASQPLENELEEGQVRVFPTALHEINALCGPNIEHLTLLKREKIPEERSELHHLILGFMVKYIWQTKEQLLYKMPGEKKELYKGVTINLSYQDPKGKEIVAIHNTAHPRFVTRGGDWIIDYWSEYFRQKNLCFVNDLWAHLLPEENITPTRDFYKAMQRLAVAISKEKKRNSISKKTPGKLKDIMLEMMEINPDALGLSELGQRQKNVDIVSERLYSWATACLSKSGKSTQFGINIKCFTR